jgi:hypothetical protein
VERLFNEHSSNEIISGHQGSVLAIGLVLVAASEA